MDKNIASLLSVNYSQLSHFGPVVSRNVKQSSVADLPSHLGVERRTIDNDIQFARFCSRENGFNDCFCLKKIVSKKFGRLDVELASFNTDFLLLLCLSRAVALFAHQRLEAWNIDSESAL